MTCNEVKDELEAYALGALEIERARAIERHLRECSGCASMARAYREAAAYLALSVPRYHASPRLKQRVMGGVGSLRSAVLTLPLRSKWTAAAAAVMAVVFVLGAAWVVYLMAEVSSLRRDNDRLADLTQLDAQQRAALLKMQSELNSAKNEQIEMSSTLEEYSTLLVVALDPDLVPSNLQGTQLASGANCNYVWSSSLNLGALTCRNLPNTALALTYELWVSKGDKMVPLGSFLPRQDGTAQMLVKFPDNAPEGPVTGYWVTLEQQGTNRNSPSNHVVLQPAPSSQAAR